MNTESPTSASRQQKEDMDNRVKSSQRTSQVHTQLLCKPAIVLYRLWAMLALFAYGSLELSPPMAAKYWLLMLTLGVVASILLTTIWMKGASQQLQSKARPWVLHWSALLIVCSLTLLNIGLTAFSTEQVANSLLLLCSLGLMTAGLYLEKRLLSCGLALAFCYFYQLLGGPWHGALTGIVFATSLWRVPGSKQ